MRDRVVGLDGFKKRWLGITLVNGRFHSGKVFDTVLDALADEPESSVVAIDIPIGLGAGNGRPADHEAKCFIGSRSSSVFFTLPEAVYAAATHAEAAELARQLTGKGISQQSYALRAKIQEATVAAASDTRLIEVHPEASFRALAGTSLTSPKKTWNGVMERRRLLATAGIVVAEPLPGDAGKAPADDVLDAAVAAWTARRVAQGIAGVLPADADRTRDRPTGVIWY
jgi:predicted RNase H-like nuclease